MSERDEFEVLKPCPFCGGDPEMVQQTKVNWAVMCHVCGAEGGWSNPSDAIALWNDLYRSALTQRAWRAWQASRSAALEEAAKECERMQKHFDTQDAIDAAEQCAMGIRALKD